MDFGFYRNRRAKDTIFLMPLVPMYLLNDKEPLCRPCNGSHLGRKCKVCESLVMFFKDIGDEDNHDHANDLNYMGNYFIYDFNDMVYSILGEYVVEKKNRSIMS